MDVACRPARQSDTVDVMELTRTIWEGEDYVPQVWASWLADRRGRLAVDSSTASTRPRTAAGAMSEKDRGNMIRNMVAGLADRLKENGSDVEGWQRLLRAYLVLGEREKAMSAADAAKRALANHADKLRRIEDTIKNLGLES